MKSFYPQLYLALTFMTMAFLYGDIPHTIAPYNEWDLSQYMLMADAAPGLAPQVNQPYASRVLGPFLVGVSPVSAAVGFWIWSHLAAAGIVCLLYRFLVERGMDIRAAFMATTLFIFNKHFFGFNVWNYFQVNDLLGLVCIGLMFKAMYEHRWRLFGAMLLFGVLTREVSLICIPTAFCLIAERRCLRSDWIHLTIAILPALAVFCLLKFLMPADGLGVIQTFKHYAVKAGAGRTWFYLLINATAPFALVPLIFYGTTLEFFKRNKFALMYLVLVLFMAFFGSNNERLVAPAYIVFYWLLATIIQKDLLPVSVKLLLPVLLFGFLGSLHHMYIRDPGMEKTVAVGLSMCSLALVSLGALIVRYRMPGRSLSG